MLLVSNFIHELNAFANTLLIFLCSGTSKLTELKNRHMHKQNFCNHVDTFLDTPKSLGSIDFNVKQLNLVEQEKKDLELRVINILDRA